MARGSLFALLSVFTLVDLERLKRAFDQGRVITRVYANSQGGCLLYFLTNGIVDSREARENYFPDKAMFDISTHVIHAWDAHVLNEREVKSALNRVMQERAALNAMEQETIDSVSARLATRH